MQANKKLINYFKKNGIQKKWFAQQLGIPPAQLSNFIRGIVPLPKRYWMEIMALTEGEVSLGDLMTDYLKPIEFLEVNIGYSKTKCEVTIKNPEVIKS